MNHNTLLVFVVVQHYQTQIIMIIISIGISALTSSLANTAHTTQRLPAFIRVVSKYNHITSTCCHYTHV